MKRFLVIVDFDDGPGPPVAGIYVMAETAAQAKSIVRDKLKDATMTAYPR